MATVNEKVSTMVERALRRDPTLPSKELQKRALRIDRNVAELSGRQFHCIYALPARRRLDGTRSGQALPGARSEPVADLLARTFEARKVMLLEALDGAFERRLQDDSVKGVNRLLTTLNRRIREFRRL